MHTVHSAVCVLLKIFSFIQNDLTRLKGVAIIKVRVVVVSVRLTGDQEVLSFRTRESMANTS